MLIHVYSLLSFICGRNCLTTISQDCMTSDYKYQTPSLVKKIIVFEKWADSPSIFCGELTFLIVFHQCSAVVLNFFDVKNQQETTGHEFWVLEKFVPTCLDTTICRVLARLAMSCWHSLNFKCVFVPVPLPQANTLRRTAPPGLAILCSRLKDTFRHWARTSFSSGWINISLFVKKSPFFLFCLVRDWCPYLM